MSDPFFPDPSAPTIATDLEDPEDLDACNLSWPAGIVLLASLLVVLPIYLLLLLQFSPWFRGLRESIVRRPGMATSGPGILIYGTSDALGFECAAPLRPMKDQKDFVDSLVILAKHHGEKIPQALYLRVRSFEVFSPTGMRSKLTGTWDASFPNFGFQKPGEGARALFTLIFCKNFEAFLPHPPVVTRLEGPMPFHGMQDGSIQFPQTIAVGDEFEVEFHPQRWFRPTMQLAKVPRESPFLDLGALPFESLALLASEATAGASAPSDRAVATARWLEENGTYSRKVPPVPAGVHPVIAFLTGSRTGHCQHFAAAFVALCRVQGIPARVAGGFATSDTRDNMFFVRDVYAHAWPEVLTTEGWAILDLSARRIQEEQRQEHSIPRPDEEQVKEILARLKKENKQRVDAAAKEGRGCGATRAENPHWGKGDSQSRQPEPPGEISQDRWKQGMPSQEKGAPEGDSEPTEARRLLPFVVFVVIVGLLVAWAFRVHEILAAMILIFLTRILAMLRRQEPTRPSQPTRSGEAPMEPSGAVESGEPVSTRIETKDVVWAFQEFSRKMGLILNASRGSEETPQEYLRRVTRKLDLDGESFHIVSRLFSIAVYGRKPLSPTDLDCFLGCLQQLLERALVMASSPAGISTARLQCTT